MPRKEKGSSDCAAKSTNIWFVSLALLVSVVNQHPCPHPRGGFRARSPGSSRGVRDLGPGGFWEPIMSGTRTEVVTGVTML